MTWRGVADERLRDELELRLEDQREVRRLVEVVVAAARIDHDGRRWLRAPSRLSAGLGLVVQLDCPPLPLGARVIAAPGWRRGGACSLDFSLVRPLSVLCSPWISEAVSASRVLLELNVGATGAFGRRRAAAEERIGGRGRVLLGIDGRAVPEQHAVAVQAERLVRAGARGSAASRRGPWRSRAPPRSAATSYRRVTVETAQAVDDAVVGGRVAQVLEALVHVHVLLYGCSGPRMLTLVLSSAKFVRSLPAICGA